MAEEFDRVATSRGISRYALASAYIYEGLQRDLQSTRGQPGKDGGNRDDADKSSDDADATHQSPGAGSSGSNKGSGLKEANPSDKEESDNPQDEGRPLGLGALLEARSSKNQDTATDAGKPSRDGLSALLTRRRS